MSKYQFTITDPENTVKTHRKDAKVSFKNTRETARMIVGKSIAKAERYLNAVIKKERCVPMRRYARGVGRTSQAKEFGTQKGRWPLKSCQFLLDLLKNLKANAKNKNIDENTLVIKSVSVNKAKVIHGRTYRAFGRVNAFDKHPCHIQIIGVAQKEGVPMISEEEKQNMIKA
ncbi:60S ribosomal L17 [Tubulinosema ratisbonensis]|uniref:60S ribosomal L17 n=1 Tax=Tubulinosema ratisbonensis TaxID=291195 RepID=A0A437AIL7_9MICR|nr:60S ribosomal L17 [Tubulinosema ratisbonensis]